SNSKTLSLTNPATEEIFCEVASASLADVDAAVTGAQRTFEQGWRDLAPGVRAAPLFKIAALIRENLEELAQLEMRNIGKPITEAREQIGWGAMIFEYYAGAVLRLCGETIPVAQGGFDFTLR